MNRVKEMARLFAPSGLEQAVKEYCIQFCKDMEVVQDGCGNLIFHRPGMGKRIAYICGMDEQGLFLSHEEKGKFRYCILGNCTADSFDNRQVLFEYGGKGIVQKDIVTFLQGSAKVGESGIVFGDASETEETLTGNGMVRAACCEVVLLLAEEETKGDLWFVFSSLYQMGKKGALVALSRIKPELAFFVEGVSVEKKEEATPVTMETGPIIKLRDGAFMDTLSLADVLDDCSLSYQLYVSAKQEIQGRPGMMFGVPTVLIGIPYESERYFVQTIKKSMMEQTKEIILEIQRRLES
ncbi:MAG: M42 family metallopeptidase [Ruminococcaceae bacterium]|nr:M42 family metallopeptidase [Oscillospiraceae bacterium]